MVGPAGVYKVGKIRTDWVSYGGATAGGIKWALDNEQKGYLMVGPAGGIQVGKIRTEGVSYGGASRGYKVGKIKTEGVSYGGATGGIQGEGNLTKNRRGILWWGQQGV